MSSRRRSRARVRTPGWLGLLGSALGAAALYVLASPPWDLSLLAWAAPAVLLLPVRGASTARAAVAGLCFGLCIAVGITSWAVHASLGYFDFAPAAAWVFAVAVWLLGAGLPYACLVAAFAWLSRRTPASLQPFVAAWLWVVVEMGRSLPLVGLPWGLLSHTQWRALWLIQIADLGGAYAVTFVVVATSIAAAELGASLLQWRTRPRALPWRSSVLATALLLLTAVYGAWRLGGDGASSSPVPVSVVQGSGGDGFHWSRSAAERELLAYLRLSEAIPRGGTGGLIVWPENAVDLYLDREPLLLRRIGALARRSGSEVLLGAPRLASPESARNAALLIDGNGRIRDRYDKRRLVPFAEEALFAAEPTATRPRYTSGVAKAPLSASSFTVGVLICWEVLFPGLVRETVREGANLLVNLSNDFWMDAGDGAAARQHFAMAVLRAVETRRALARASAGGRSGVVSPAGRVEASVIWGTAGSATALVQPRSGTTPYVRFGEGWVALVGAALAVAARGRLRRPASQGQPATVHPGPARRRHQGRVLGVRR